MVDKVSETSTDTNSENKSENVNDPHKADGTEPKESTDLRIKANEIINKNIQNRKEYKEQKEKEKKKKDKNNVEDEIDELKFTDKEDYNVLIAAQKLIDEDIILNKNKPTKLSTGWFSSSIDLNLLKENIELQLKYYQVSTGGTRKKYKTTHKSHRRKSKRKSRRKSRRR